MSVLASLVWLLTAQLPPGAPVLDLPVACVIGEQCLVQKLVDRKAGEGRQDYRCGVLTTEEHDGVDFRVRTLADMDAGVAVVAAAPGRVLRVRDGMPDQSVRVAGSAGLEGRQAGNAVVIDHGDGWHTQYSHLREGSVTVRPGEPVRAGQPLGKIGMSGNAEFPHVHFEVRYKNKTIDPFMLDDTMACAVRSELAESLWGPAARKALGYQPTQVITAGFASVRPDREAERARRKPVTVLPAAAPALVLWAESFGVRAGDVQHFRVTGPGGGVVHEQRVVIDKSLLSWFAFSGKRRPASGWAPGDYTGVYQLMRDGVVLSEARAVVTLR